LIDKFNEDTNFKMVTGGSTNDLLSNAHLLISDWSGSAFSFAFGLERPVLFIDTPQKINNLDYRDYINKPVEIAMRDHLGAVITPGEYSNVGNIIRNLCADPLSYRNRIRRLRSTTVFNLGDSAALGARVLDQLACSIRSRDI
jgi:YidC/Oxa1 family membrane protein insertase